MSGDIPHQVFTLGGEIGYAPGIESGFAIGIYNLNVFSAARGVEVVQIDRELVSLPVGKIDVDAKRG